MVVPMLPSHSSGQSESAHQPLDGAAGDRPPFALQLPPDLPCAIDAEVLSMDALHLRCELVISFLAS